MRDVVHYLEAWSGISQFKESNYSLNNRHLQLFDDAGFLWVKGDESTVSSKVDSNFSNSNPGITRVREK